MTVSHHKEIRLQREEYEAHTKAIREMYSLQREEYEAHTEVTTAIREIFADEHSSLVDARDEMASRIDRHIKKRSEHTAGVYRTCCW